MPGHKTESGPSPSFNIIKYDAACRAIAEAESIDEVKKIRDVAIAMRAYAKQAGNRQMEADAIAIRMRATRGVDHMRQKQKATVGLAKGARERGTKRGTTRAAEKPASLAEAGISKNLAHEGRKLGALSDKEFEKVVTAAREAVGRVIKDAINAQAKENSQARRRASRAAEPIPDGFEYRVGDCRKKLADIPDNSVPLILTDPPYGNDAEELLKWLAEFGAAKLVEGGSLICYFGKSHLDKDLAILSAHLRYWWLCSMPHTSKQRFPGKFVISGFRPIAWYVKGHRRGRTLLPDVFDSPAPDKLEHKWAQGEGGVWQPIEHLTEPGELTVDPFAGTGNWGRIACDMGRRWIGCDIVKGGSTSIE